MNELTKAEMVKMLKEKGCNLRDYDLFKKKNAELRNMLGLPESQQEIKQKKKKEEKEAIKKINIEVYDNIKRELDRGYDGPYLSILKLKTLLTAADIPFKMDQVFNGFQITVRYKFKTNKKTGRIQYKSIDAVEHDLSLGHNKDLIEIQGGLTKEEYSEENYYYSKMYNCKGNLTAIEVMRRIVYCVKHKSKFYKEGKK